MVLESLLRELNPRNDLDRHHLSEPNYKANQGLIFNINIIKSVVRGGAIGALVGSALGGLYALTTGEDVKDYVKIGALISGFFGATEDVGQYSFRLGSRIIIDSFYPKKTIKEQ